MRSANHIVLRILRGFFAGFIAFLLLLIPEFVQALVPAFALFVLLVLFIFTLSGGFGGFASLVGTVSGFLIPGLIFIGWECVPASLPIVLGASAATIAVLKIQSRFEGLMVSIGGFLSGILSYIAIFSLLEGSNIIRKNVESISEPLLQQFAELFRQQNGLVLSGSQLRESIHALVPASIIIFSMLGGCIAFYGAGMAAQKSARLARPFLPFRAWAVPRSFQGGMTCLLIVSLIGSAFDWPGFSSVLPAVMGIYLFAYFTMGLAVIVYFCQMKRNILPLLFAVFSIVFWGVFPLLILGFVEQILHIRAFATVRLISKTSHGKQDPKNENIQGEPEEKRNDDDDT